MQARFAAQADQQASVKCHWNKDDKFGMVDASRGSALSQ